MLLIQILLHNLITIFCILSTEDPVQQLSAPHSSDGGPQVEQRDSNKKCECQNNKTIKKQKLPGVYKRSS